MSSLNSQFCHHHLRLLYFKEPQILIPSLGLPKLDSGNQQQWPTQLLESVHNAQRKLAFEWRINEIRMTQQGAEAPEGLSSTLLLLDNGQYLLQLNLPQPEQALDCYALIMLLPAKVEDAYRPQYWLLEAGQSEYQGPLQHYLCAWEQDRHRLINLEGPEPDDLATVMCQILGLSIVHQASSWTPLPVKKIDPNSQAIKKLHDRLFGDFLAEQQTKDP